MIALCFLALNVKAQTISTDTLKNSGQNLHIRANGTKSIMMHGTKDVYISSGNGRISLTAASGSGIYLNNNIGIGAGSNWSPTSPINCIAFPHYIDNQDAISHGASIGDIYIVTDTTTTSPTKFILGIVQ